MNFLGMKKHLPKSLYKTIKNKKPIVIPNNIQQNFLSSFNLKNGNKPLLKAMG